MFQATRFQATLRKATHLLLWIFLLIPVAVLALPSDSEQMLHIKADRTLFNYKTGLDTYEGHVFIKQGTTELKADRIITQKDSQHKIIKATAYGMNNLAQYTTTVERGQPLFEAQSKIITFYPITSIIKLEGSVLVTQGKNSFRGPIIIYNVKAQTLDAPPSKEGYATIIIDPKQLKTS